MRHFILGLTLLCGVWAMADTRAQDAAALDRDFGRSTLQIATPDGQLHTFRVWVADNEPRRARGLMFVKEMAADAGMLFLYPQAQPIGMWMKNTDLSLDMLFVSANGRVIRVVPRTKPHSLDTIESGGNALGVIELNAGTAEKLGIRAGAQVIHPAFLPR